jgi:cyclophilin family peptidyl-prolyl cis-trans isomerase
MTIRRLLATAIVACLALGTLQAQGRRGAAPAATSNPVLVLETLKGKIAIELFRDQAPKSVDHIVGLVNRNFYRAQRFHRVEASLVQFGDPGTRNMTMIDSWGTGNSGSPIGVAEFTKHLNVRGAVGLAHGGDPRYADSQLYILKTADPSLNGKHVVVGRVVTGMDVVDKLVKTDVIRNASMN